MARPAARAATRRAPRSRSDRPNAARNTILDALERLLALEPLHQITIWRILDEAETSRATFYYHFDSKFGALAGLLDRTTDEIFETVQPFLAREAQVPAAQQTLTAVAESWRRHHVLFDAVVENWHADQQVKELWLATVDRFIELVAGRISLDRDAGLARGTVDPHEVATLLVWGTERLLYIAGQGTSTHVTADNVGALLADMWVREIYPD